MDSISAETRSEIYEKLWTRMPRLNPVCGTGGAANGGPVGNFRIDDFIALVKRYPVIYSRADKHNKQEYADTWDQLEAILKTPKKFLMMKWKGLRDNFRVELKKEFYSPPEARYVSKWVHYRKLAFLREQVLPTLDQKLDGEPTPDDLHQIMQFVQNQEQQPSPKEHSYTNSEVKQEREESNDDSQPSDTDFNFNHFQEPDTNHLPEITITPKFPLELQQPINLQSRKRRHSQNAPSTSSSAVTGGGGGGHHPQQDDDYHFLMSIHPYLRQLPLPVKLKVRLQMQQVLFNELMKQPIADEED